MNPNLYVIKGGENYGKTSICWKLLDRLKPIIECYNYWKLSFEDTTVYNPTNLCYEVPDSTGTYHPADFIFVARLNNPSHCKVAIISAGDEADYVKKNIYKLLGRGVYHIVCCERSKCASKSTNIMLHSEFKITSHNEHEVLIPRNSAETSRIANDLFNILSKL